MSVATAKNAFDAAIAPHTGGPLATTGLEVIQINIGLTCNLECEHCHVVSSPRRREQMPWEIMQEVLRVADEVQPAMVDITGGAPEMNPDFRRFVRTLRAHGHPVQVRTNLTVFFAPGYDWIPPFLRDHEVALVASLPCYTADNVDAQRGDGVFMDSVRALQWLNDLGYGKQPQLPLHLVYNPGGAFLPPPQDKLTADYKERLAQDFGIVFTDLFTITNMPIGRFRADLKRDGEFDAYMQTLQDNFNPATIDGLMCRNQLEVAWDGSLYDCDFHLAHRRKVDGIPDNIRDFDPQQHAQREIVTRDYCFGCTAGAGSSCGGSLT